MNVRKDRSATREPKPPKRKKLNQDAEVDGLRAELERIAAKPGPVLAGPFTGEIGFELLYWIPLLRWAVREVPSLQGRLVVMSRGGVESWLEGLDAQYVELLSLFPTDDFARHRALSDKQRELREFDHRVLAAVRERLELDDPGVLHPSLLYNAYFRLLKTNELAYAKAVTHHEDHAEGLTAIYQPIDPPRFEQELSFLPDDFVAVRFYSSESFPDEPASRALASTVTASLGRATNVVMLGHPFDIDDHGDVASDRPDGAFDATHLMTPANNLAIQTAIISRARAFVGTYGGFSYLSPFLGVPSLSFTMDRARTHSWHNVLAQRLFDGPGFGDYVSLRRDDLPLIALVTAGLHRERDAIGEAAT